MTNYRRLLQSIRFLLKNCSQLIPDHQWSHGNSKTMCCFAVHYVPLSTVPKIGAVPMNYYVFASSLAVQSFQLTSFPGRRQLPPQPGVVNLWHLPRVAENVNISSRLCTTFILFGCFRLCAFGRIWHSRDVTRCNKLSGCACQRWKWKLNMSQLTELSHERLRWAASCAWTDHAGHTEWFSVYIKLLTESYRDVRWYKLI